MRFFNYFFFALFSAILLISCAESDDFSFDPDLKLTFQADVVRFDTVFTAVGSATRHFKIYNRNNKSLKIESIEVMNPDKSGFRMNIDGESGIRLTNIDILKKDSLYGFLQITVDPLNVNSPVLVRDSIQFVTNGNVQYLYLEAIGRDVHKWTGKVFSSDATLTPDKPYLIYDSIRIDEGVTVSIAEDVVLYFHDKASVQVYGTLDVHARSSNPVIFRGDRLDYYNGNIPFDNVSGLWQGIVFHPQSYHNSLIGAVVKNTVTGLTFLPSDTRYKKASLLNTVIHNASENVLIATNCDIEVKNCQLTNARQSILKLNGGSYSFLHCTIANYYRFSPRFVQSVVLDNAAATMQQCVFINSIIYGSFTNELLISSTLENYQFVHCLIRDKGITDSHFEHTIWNADPKFIATGTNALYECNFSLQESSAAKDEADATYSVSLPEDLKGTPRLTDSGPDIGCYEWH